MFFNKYIYFTDKTKTHIAVKNVRYKFNFIKSSGAGQPRSSVFLSIIMISRVHSVFLCLLVHSGKNF